MTKPVDLIIANVMHEAIDQLAVVDRLQTLAKKAFPNADVNMDAGTDEIVARQLLRRISDDAPMKAVYAALAAAGAPASAELVNEGLQAVRDRQS